MNFLIKAFWFVLLWPYFLFSWIWWNTPGALKRCNQAIDKLERMIHTNTRLIELDAVSAEYAEELERENEVWRLSLRGLKDVQAKLMKKKLRHG